MGNERNRSGSVYVVDDMSNEMRIIVSDVVDGVEAAHLVCDCGGVDERSAKHYRDGSNVSPLQRAAYWHWKETGHALPKVVDEQGRPWR